MSRVHRWIATLLVTWGASASAQAPDQEQLRQMMEQMKSMEMPNEAQMKLMVEQAGAMQACVAGMDMSKLEAMRGESEALMDEVKALCVAGQRDQAQSRAIEYGQRVAQSPELKKMAECTADMRGMLPQMAQLSQQAVATDLHVCDQP